MKYSILNSKIYEFSEFIFIKNIDLLCFINFIYVIAIYVKTFLSIINNFVFKNIKYMHFIHYL